jgi:hypothetical protein
MTEVLREALFWVAVVCCVVASAAILRATLTAPGASRGRRAVEVAYAIVPALLLAAVLGATWPRVRAARAHAPLAEEHSAGGHAPHPSDAHAPPAVR